MKLRDMATNLLNIFVATVESFLGLRLVLRLFSANPDNSFVSWVYDMSSVLLEPFRGIFPTREIASGVVLEFSTLFAMLVYALLGLFVFMVIDTLTSRKK